MRALGIRDEPLLGRALIPVAAGVLAAGALATGADAMTFALALGGASAALLGGVVAVEDRTRVVVAAFALASTTMLIATALRATSLPADHVARVPALARTQAPAGLSAGPSAVDGIIVSSVPRLGARLLTVRAEHVRSVARSGQATGLLGVTISHPTREWPVGARVRVVGRLRRPRSFGNPSGYDIARALARRGIFATMFLWDDAGATVLEAPAADLASMLARLRERIAARVDADVPEPARGFVVAVLSGVDGSVDEKTRRMLARTGLAHATSVSGFHIAVVAGAAILIAGACLRRSQHVLLHADVWKLAALTGLLPVVAYAAIAGESVPAIRSVAMYAVVLGALLGERPPDALRALAAAAIALAVAVPDILGDISFELSFVSVAALIMVARRGSQSRDEGAVPVSRARRLLRMWLVEPLTVSVAATLATAPLTAWHFQQVSLVAPIANLLALPFLGPGTLLPGLSALPLLGVAPALADRLLTLSGVSAGIGLRIAAACAQIPFAAVATPMPSRLELASCYAWLLLLATRGARSGAARDATATTPAHDERSSAPQPRRPSPRLLAAALLAILSAGDVGYWIWERTANPRLRATFLSVGQGDAAVVELPRGAGVIVIDGGGFAGGFDTGERLIAPFLRMRKVMRLRAIVLSHPQLDHYGGLAALAEEFAPREFWSNGTTSAAPGFARLQRALDAAGARRRVLSRADAPITLGDASAEIVHPDATAGEDPNNGSLVVRVVHGCASVLFTGDVEAPAEAEIVDAGRPIASTVLKVPHHGSATSSSARFLAAVAPRAAVISAGVDNRFHFPATTVLDRLAVAGASVWRTDVDGAVWLESSGTQLTIGSARAQRTFDLKSPQCDGTRERF